MPKIIEDQTIYQSAIRVVIERGYSGATTKQIAEAAGISEVTLFRKYGNKAQLVKQAIMAMAGQIDLQTAAAYTGDVAADLLRVVETYQASAGEFGQFFYTVLLEIPRHPDLSDSLESPIELINHVGKLIARYQSDGVLVQEHPLHAVAALWGPLMATNLIRSAAPAVAPPQIDLQAHVAQFLDGRRL
jgi:AcrR family transcriptional regulator